MVELKMNGVNIENWDCKGGTLTKIALWLQR